MIGQTFLWVFGQSKFFSGALRCKSVSQKISSAPLTTQRLLRGRGSPPQPPWTPPPPPLRKTLVRVLRRGALRVSPARRLGFEGCSGMGPVPVCEEASQGWLLGEIVVDWVGIPAGSQIVTGSRGVPFPCASDSCILCFYAFDHPQMRRTARGRLRGGTLWGLWWGAMCSGTPESCDAVHSTSCHCL